MSCRSASILAARAVSLAAGRLGCSVFGLGGISDSHDIKAASVVIGRHRGLLQLPEDLWRQLLLPRLLSWLLRSLSRLLLHLLHGRGLPRSAHPARSRSPWRPQ